MFTFALTGRGVTWRFTPQGVASLALGYGGHWAFSPLGLSGTRRVSHALDMRKICGNPRDLWAKTKRTMRQRTGRMYLFSHGSHRFSQKPFGLLLSKKTRDSSGRRRWALTIAQWPCGVLFAKNTSPPVAVGRMEQDETGWAGWAVGAMRFRAHLPIGRLDCWWVRARCGGSCGGGCSSRGSSGARRRRWVPR